MKIFSTPRFEKRLKLFVNYHPDLSKIVQKIMKEIVDNPFSLNLKTHKLSGSLKDCFSSRITYHYRIVFVTDKDELCFIDIGSHDELY